MNSKIKLNIWLALGLFITFFIILFILLVGIKFLNEVKNSKLPVKTAEIKTIPEIQISKFMISESQAPIQHVAAGLFSLPGKYQRYKTFTYDNFTLPNKEKTYVEKFYHQNKEGDVNVFIYKRIVDYPNKGDSQFHILFKTINQNDEWYEIDVHGTLTAFGAGNTVNFWTNPPYSADRFKEVSVNTYKVKQFWTDQLFKTMISLYYSTVVPLPVNDTPTTHLCYDATGTFFYAYKRDFDGSMNIILVDRYGNRNVYKSSSSDKDYVPYKAPWRNVD